MGVRELFKKIYQGMELDGEAILGRPLLELVGDRRILIENHCGVSEYSDRQICIQIKNGNILVSGSKLQMALMSKEKIIICGSIESVHLVRGC